MRDDKLRRLEEVARLYYEQNKTQAEIAQQMKVSRPLISRMLDEARRAGIVEISIRSKCVQDHQLLERIKAVYGLKGGVLVADGSNNEVTNQTLGRAAISLVEQLGGGHVGLGWGHLIGLIVSSLENELPRKTSITDICPMIGNSGVPIRNYHSNENVRIIAQQLMAEAHYLFTPAVADSRQDRELLLQTEPYKGILREWERLDIALVNIGDYPSTPDLGSRARFGDLLTKHKAVGRLIAYYFDIEGNMIESENDFVIQIPLEVLKRCPRVVGICSANTSSKALTGALKAGILTHIIAREKTLNLIEY